MADDVTDRRKRFEQLFTENYAAVVRYSRRRASPESASDIVADTFLVAWRRLDSVPRDALPWLLGVARKTLANYRRAAQRREALAGKLKALERAEFEDDHASQGVLAALARLPEKDREVLMLTAWEGLDSRRASSVLECSQVAFRVRLHRARQRLRTELERPSSTNQPLPNTIGEA